VFEQLDDLRPKMKATPKLVIAASAYVLMLGILIGILIGRRKWELWPWIETAFWGVVLLRLLSPVYRQIADLLKDDDGH
jgi:hypothetical protein